MLKILAVICVVFPLAMFSQTPSELASRYPHHEVYGIEDGVQMTARYAANGSVCEMQIEQAHFGSHGADLGNGIDERRINAIVDKLVPPSERGKKDPSHSMSIGLGQTMERSDAYEKVYVSVLEGIGSCGGTVVAIIKWRHRTCQAQD